MSEPSEIAVKDFWNWFHVNAGSIVSEIEKGARLDELDRKVNNLAPDLSWEVGPGIDKQWQLVISPNLNRSLRKTACMIVAGSPELDEWEFHSARQKKDWDYRVEIEIDKIDTPLSIDAKSWRFVLLRYPDGVQEILIEANGIPKVEKEDRRLICEVVLESLLGEETLLNSVDEFELVDKFESQLEAQVRSIRDLYSAVTGKEK